MTDDGKRLGSDQMTTALLDAEARISELQAELAFYKGFHDGVCKDGTHVVVPVVPDRRMYEQMRNVLAYDGSIDEIWAIGIRAAQPERQQGE